MYGKIVWKTFDHFAIAKDVSCIGMMFVIGERCIDDGINVCFGKADYFAELADDGAAFKSIVCGE